MFFSEHLFALDRLKIRQQLIHRSSFTFAAMQMRWLAIVSAIVLITACFFPWVTVESKNIVVSGVDATGTSFGKPGYMHFLMSALGNYSFANPQNVSHPHVHFYNSI